MNTLLEKKCTFVIPIRIDCEERVRNLRTVVDWLIPLCAPILILEADKEQHISFDTFGNNSNNLLSVHFVKDEERVFHRTHYINELIKLAKTPFVAVWDADIIIDREQILRAVCYYLIEERYTLICPYNKECAYLNEHMSHIFSANHNIDFLHHKKLKSYIGRPVCGGAYIVNKRLYNSIGGENENFIGWGPEDAERIRRTQIMGHKMGWIEDGNCAYHLYHPQNENSRFFSEETALSTRQEFIKVCSMNREELSEYIKTMPR
ncbi:MAG: hypothetical protein IKY64_05670 [Bacteroidaceae bacterium]|nr:hypothetical protein [Bacteroidaceae bacterium]